MSAQSLASNQPASSAHATAPSQSLILIKGGQVTPFLEGFEESSKAAIDWFLRNL
jgi:hypothetical protein